MLKHVIYISTYLACALVATRFSVWGWVVFAVTLIMLVMTLHSGITSNKLRYGHWFVPCDTKKKRMAMTIYGVGIVILLCTNVSFYGVGIFNKGDRIEVVCDNLTETLYNEEYCNSMKLGLSFVPNVMIDLTETGSWCMNEAYEIAGEFDTLAKMKEEADLKGSSITSEQVEEKVREIIAYRQSRIDEMMLKSEVAISLTWRFLILQFTAQFLFIIERAISHGWLSRFKTWVISRESY